MLTFGMNYKERLRRAIDSAKESLKNPHLKIDFVTRIESVLWEVNQEDIKKNIKKRAGTTPPNFQQINHARELAQ